MLPPIAVPGFDFDRRAVEEINSTTLNSFVVLPLRSQIGQAGLGASFRMVLARSMSWSPLKGLTM